MICVRSETTKNPVIARARQRPRRSRGFSPTKQSGFHPLVRKRYLPVPLLLRRFAGSPVPDAINHPRPCRRPRDDNSSHCEQLTPLCGHESGMNSHASLMMCVAPKKPKIPSSRGREAAAAIQKARIRSNILDCFVASLLAKTGFFEVHQERSEAGVA